MAEQEPPKPPAGYHAIPEEDRRKAKTFFDRGTTVAGTGQYDYAIEMFVQGLNIDPDAVEAHQLLRDISLRRKASGGKSLGMFEKMKIKTNTKDDKANMVAAEKLMAYDPGNTDHMMTFMSAAYKAGFYDSVMWVGPILHRANVDGGKPDVKVFLSLKDHYKALDRSDLALQECQSAASMRPEDGDLQREVKELSAMDAMRKGGYDRGSSFRDSVKDMSAQQKLLQADADVHDVDIMTRQIMDAEAEWKAQPNESGKLMKLVEYLLKTEDLKQEERAVSLLENEFERTRQFRFRQNIGKIRMAQRNREERVIRDRLNKNVNDEALREEYRQFIAAKLEEEYNEYALWADNYPTDLAMRYEMAKRLFQLGRFDEAIPALQTARQDPKIRVDATIALGRAFLEAQFVDEAVDTLKALIDEYQGRNDAKSKDIFYWYARSLEAHNANPLAIKAYSQVAQWDFNYRDVQQRIKRLRAAAAGGTAPPTQA